MFSESARLFFASFILFALSSVKNVLIKDSSQKKKKYHCGYQKSSQQKKKKKSDVSKFKEEKRAFKRLTILQQ